MPLTVKQTIMAKQAARAVTGGLSEVVVYVPRSGRQRTVSAIVERAQAAPSGDMGGRPAPVFIVTVANSSTDGISSKEIDEGGDKIRLEPRIGEDAENRSISTIITHDEGSLALEVR